MCVYDSGAFNERVNFAASYISARRPSTRRFDTCFEMHDGDVVVTALIRRAEARPLGKLAANLFDYISEDNARKTAARFESIPTKNLPNEAAQLRDKRKREFEQWLAQRHSQ